jgi:phosphonatase-like hydrolase
MIQLGVFDMAGTVLNEGNVVYKTVHRSIVEAGWTVDLDTVLLHGAGKEKLQAIRDVIAELDGTPAADEVVMPIYAQFQRYLDEAYRDGVFEEQPGATAIFEYLQSNNIRVVINTGYSRLIADHLIQRLGWQGSPLIDMVVTADDVSKGRPHPDMIVLAMNHLQIVDQSAVFKIGDSIIDIVEGQNAGCGFNFGITTGAHTREQLLMASPTAVLDHLEELKSWINAD